MTSSGISKQRSGGFGRKAKRTQDTEQYLSQMGITEFKELLGTQAPHLTAVGDSMVSKFNIQTLTFAQANILPKFIEKNTSWVIQSPTGSGKTITFGLCSYVMMRPEVDQPQVLIFCHTQQLCDQVAAVLRELGSLIENSDKLVATCYGSGHSESFSARIIVGTARGIRNCIEGGLISINNIKMMIIDEADELLSEEARGTRSKTNNRRGRGGRTASTRVQEGQGVSILRIRDTLEQRWALKRDDMLTHVYSNDEIVKKTDFSREEEVNYAQVPFLTILSSATFPKKVKAFIQTLFKSSKPRLFKHVQKVPANILHFAIQESDLTQKIANIRIFLQSLSFDQVIVFVNRKREADSVARQIGAELGTVASVGVMHGSLTPQERQQTIEKFQNKTINVLVASSMIARGYDNVSVSHVINLNFPPVIEGVTDPHQEYVHRAGRCGRFGYDGFVFTFVDGETNSLMRETAEEFDFVVNECTVEEVLSKLVVDDED
ncbi:hypothetical protein PCE1_003697 [Barthelona sp. PCE]